jgi:predicted dithiol-disulfide oxidoreductase (DUF899 family)
MSLPKVVSRDEWLEARRDLLAEEKAMTRARDALGTKRRQLPMVRLDQDYVFEGPEGAVHLRDLFHDRRQLIVQHFMFDPEWDEGCSSCTGSADEISAGLLAHLAARDTSFVVVSRAPFKKIERYKSARGWAFTWYSSFGTDFNYDFNVTIDASIAPVMWNYRTMPELEDLDMGWMGEGSSEQPGYSTFLRDGDTVLPHLLRVRPGHRVPRRLVLLPRPHRPRAPGGVGGAQGPRRQRSPRPTRLLELTAGRAAQCEKWCSPTTSLTEMS